MPAQRFPHPLLAPALHHALPHPGGCASSATGGITHFAVSPNQRGCLARSHQCWERGRTGGWGWGWAGALGWAHFRVVLPLKGVYHTSSLGGSQLNLHSWDDTVKLWINPQVFTYVQGRSMVMRLRKCWMTVNFSTAKAPAHHGLPPLGMATDYFVFPSRVFFSPCFSARTHPWPNMDQQPVTWCAAAPETLLCGARPMESRGAVASRSQAPMRWKGFIQLRIKTFYSVKEKNLPAPPQSIVDWQEESVFSTSVESPGGSQAWPKVIWAPDRNTD